MAECFFAEGVVLPVVALGLPVVAQHLLFVSLMCLIVEGSHPYQRCLAGLQVMTALSA